MSVALRIIESALRGQPGLRPNRARGMLQFGEIIGGIGAQTFIVRTETRSNQDHPLTAEGRGTSPDGRLLTRPH
jgi:hypothetical protein